MNKPLISIITPVYNSDKFVVQTIKSIIDQTYPNWELILIDDGSKDYSVKLIEALMRENEDPRIKLILHSENLGVARARNTGIHLAKGRYIAFIDSDDIWARNKLYCQLKLMNSYNYPLCHTAYQKIDQNGTIVTDITPVSRFVDYRTLLKHNEMGMSTVMYDTKIFGKRYFSDIGWEDFSMWLGLLKDTKASLGILTPLVYYRIHQGSSSYNKLKSAKKTWTVYREVEHFSFFKSMYYFVHYAIFSSIKYMKK